MSLDIKLTQKTNKIVLCRVPNGPVSTQEVVDELVSRLNSGGETLFEDRTDSHYKKMRLGLISSTEERNLFELPTRGDIRVIPTTESKSVSGKYMVISEGIHSMSTLYEDLQYKDQGSQLSL